MAALSENRRTFVAIFGPTGVGKTQLATQLAMQLNPGVFALSVDSVQVYQSLNIGSAKPSAAELEVLPHKLIDVANVGEVYTVGEYRRDVERVLQDHAPITEPIILVGGTGFYFRALVTGLFELNPVDPKIREELNAELEQNGLESLYERLTQNDPEAARKIKPQDSYRILRALEVIASQGQKLSEISQNHDPKAGALLEESQIVRIGLSMDRDELRLRIRKRAEQMLSSGWISEVEQLRARGFKDWPALKSVGYKQIGMMLDGELSNSELLQAIETATMQLAKKQMTWFRADKNIQWFDARKDLRKALVFAKSSKGSRT